MQRKPPRALVPDSSTTPNACTSSQRRRWHGRHYRLLAACLLRGLAYGTGTGIAGLLAYWAQQHL
ncbi:hypothetical protein FM076_00780 [Streptomyces albus subsp. chlorinus]|uniref:hypothetical protein n=1 Tax=Streptomyces albus TaxID=1888 RepID=UPI00156E5C9E|nr:hypothetical protein [Streptomyces albus]NSC19827.1 hypothetical protein [Streptomyces albus subsp. chlorinus]